MTCREVGIAKAVGAITEAQILHGQMLKAIVEELGDATFSTEAAETFDMVETALMASAENLSEALCEHRCRCVFCAGATMGGPQEGEGDRDENEG